MSLCIGTIAIRYMKFKTFRNRKRAPKLIMTKHPPIHAVVLPISSSPSPTCIADTMRSRSVLIRSVVAHSL